MLFQPTIKGINDSLNDKTDDQNLQLEYSHPGTKEIIPYAIGVKKSPTLFIKDIVDVDGISLLEESFDKDLIWSIAGGISSDENHQDMPLLGKKFCFKLLRNLLSVY